MRCSWTNSGYQSAAEEPSLSAADANDLATASASSFTRRSALLGMAGTAAWSLAPRRLRAQTPGQPLRVFAAADLTPVMPVIAQLYRQKTGVELKVSLGASGVLVTQIQNGAPADIFLGADFVFPEKLVASNLTTEKEPVAYARGSLVLFALKDSPLQPLNLDRLRDPRAQKVAIANELHAPYGRAGTAALTRMHYLPAIQNKLVIAENVAQTGEFVLSGNAQLGLVSLTLAASEKYKQVGTFVRFPSSQYPEIRQCAVILKSGNTAEAQRFLNWLLSSEIQPKLPNVGLQPVA